MRVDNGILKGYDTPEIVNDNMKSKGSGKEVMLLTRDEFREAVFARSEGKCSHCGAPAVDAHHILERRLFPDGGYYLNNGAALCGTCHLRAEQTLLTAQHLRCTLGIEIPVLPPHLYADREYDKWGNVVLPGGFRLMESCSMTPVFKKLCKSGCFGRLVKYPRTFHLPWSPSVPSDDRVLSSLSGLEGREIVVTEKMDGENTTIYAPDGHVHARSVSGVHHPSQAWVRAMAPKWVYDLPYGFRLCRENLYALHSIRYNELASYFLGFSLWDGLTCLGWDETMDYFSLMGICSVPVLWRGRYSQELLEKIGIKDDTMEGYVVRVVDSFHLRDFSSVVGKWVRPNHVAKTTHHWRLRWTGEKNGVR